VTAQEIRWGELGCPTKTGSYRFAGEVIQVKTIHIMVAENDPVALFTVVAFRPRWVAPSSCWDIASPDRGVPAIDCMQAASRIATFACAAVPGTVPRLEASRKFGLFALEIVLLDPGRGQRRNATR